MQYGSIMGHAPANLAPDWAVVFVNHCSLCFAKQLLEEVGLRTGGTFPKKSTPLAVLTSSFALLAFSKYWRAQITPIIDPYCIIRFTYWFLQFFTSPDSCQYRFKLPWFSDLYCRKPIYYFDFTVRFSINEKVEQEEPALLFWEFKIIFKAYRIQTPLESTLYPSGVSLFM